MAYPTVSKPYGLKPINRVDGLPYAGAIRQLPIASDYNTPIYNGDIVRIAAGGTVAKSDVTVDSTTAAANYTAGVSVGVMYTNTQSQRVEAQWYPGNVAATSAVAYVVDDPMAAFKAVVVSSGNTVAATSQYAVGTNVKVVQNTGSNITGDSAVAILQPANSAGSAAALPLRVIDVIPETATSSGFVELVVKFNNHQYNTPADAWNFVAA